MRGGHWKWNFAQKKNRIYIIKKPRPLAGHSCVSKWQTEFVFKHSHSNTPTPNPVADVCRRRTCVNISGRNVGWP